VTDVKLPLVSVVIPARNAGKFVHRAIDSALKQDYPNVQVVVVNDGCKDENRASVQSLRRADSLRLAAQRGGQVRSASVSAFFSRRMLQADPMRSALAREFSASVILPPCCFSPELISRGTNPR
jgi:cellulose synthase/poly-beta-1,6-N-acetylglucosamine synthase-like glycosyltransferase